MKKITRRFLLKYGLFNPIDHIYSMSKTIAPNVLYREIQYRIFGTPDGYAIPPSRFIYLVDGIGWVRDYYVGGKAIVENILKHLEEKYIDIYDFEKILDFGCGSGRLVRHFAFMKDTELYGCDYNKELINWCKKNLNLAKFQTNNMKPPIDYADNMFDFVYLRSVFTHLGEEMQNKWMKEFGRILKPGGILHFTTHGSQFLEKLSDEQKKNMRREN